MARLFVFLVCVAAVTIAILKNPGVDFLRNIRSAAAETSSSSVEPSGEEPAPSSAVGNRSGAPTGTAASSPATARAPRAASVGPSVSNFEIGSASNRAESPRVYVQSGAATIYSSNSPQGHVLGVLKEGDPVEPGLKVLSAEGLWVEVRLDQQTSGFIRGENLRRD